MKKIIITSSGDLLLLIEKEFSHEFKECIELFHWYYDNDMILISYYELVRMIKDHLNNEERGNVLDYIVNPN